MNKFSYSSVFVVVSLTAILVTMGFNFIVDPFTYYHRPWTTINISENQRYANPGLARQFDYTTALVGTSHVMELESGRLSEIIGEPAINLSISAGLIREQVDLVELILWQKKADSILWEMNFPSFSVGDIYNDTVQGYPHYLYKPGIETPLRYLISFDTLVQSRDALLNGGSVTLDNRNRVEKKEFSQARVLENWRFLAQRWNDELKEFWANYQQKVEPAGQILERRVMPLLREYPEVKFKLFLPPSSILFYLRHKDMGAEDFAKWLAFRQALANLAARFPNAELFDFQTEKTVIENLDLFRDLEHFNHDILENMFDRINQHENLVDSTSIQKNNRDLNEWVNRYGKTFCAEVAGRCSEALKADLGAESRPGE